MTSDLMFERWDVVVAPFPFTDVNVRKPRPVLVLSSYEFNKAHGHFVTAMITTGAKSCWPSDYQIVDFNACGLRHASVVRWKLVTLPTLVAPRRIGRLSSVDCEAMRLMFRQLFSDP